MEYINKMLAIQQYAKDSYEEIKEKMEAKRNPNLIAPDRMYYMQEEDEMEMIKYSLELNGI